MLKENKKTLILASIITILPIFVGLYFWNKLPEQMGTHFGVKIVFKAVTILLHILLIHIIVLK